MNGSTDPSTPVEQAPQTGVDTGAPVPVAMEYVESQLMELWRDVAEAAQASGGAQSVTTAQVLNLIVHAESYQQASSIVPTIDRITALHPSRVIVAITDPAEGEMPVQAWVSIHCQVPPSGGRQVCAEQVSVAAGGEQARQLPAAIIPLLVPSLPVFLWWPHGDPFDEYIFRNLALSINRLIVDSSTFENPEGTLAKMANQARSQWPKIMISDMNWGRITTWREMIAGFFDVPAQRPYLDEIGHVNIQYAITPGPREGRHGPVNRTQALLMAGWLASRLGWEFGENIYQLIHTEASPVPQAHLNMRARKHPVTVDIEPVMAKAPVSGDLLCVTLEAPGEAPDKPNARFAVTLNDARDACVMAVSLIDSEPVQRTSHLQPIDTGDLLNQDLEMYSHDTVYEEALAVVGRIIRGTRHTTRSTEMSHRMPTGEPISAAPGGRQQTQAAPPGAQPPASQPQPGRGDETGPQRLDTTTRRGL
ncbi:MAG TPA: glucose-6-phosphate dehydrogenase assembly protein OpcA [Chloroflexia bacterium]|nr:glucose-6-phosphate dehydrogenase assembly protein OpcA [Chloroflexia bacterium]